jgi:hypothetical protein
VGGSKFGGEADVDSQLSECASYLDIDDEGTHLEVNQGLFATMVLHQTLRRQAEQDYLLYIRLHTNCVNFVFAAVLFECMSLVLVLIKILVDRIGRNSNGRDAIFGNED